MVSGNKEKKEKGRGVCERWRFDATLTLLFLETGAAVRLASFDGLRLLALIIGGGENVGL